MTPEMQKQIEQEGVKYAEEMFSGWKPGPEKMAQIAQSKTDYIAGRTVSAERLEQLEAELARLTKMMEDDLKRQVRLNRPGASEQVQEEAWQNFKTKNNIQ